MVKFHKKKSFKKIVHKASTQWAGQQPQENKLSTRFRQSKPYTIKPEPFPRSLQTRMKYAAAWEIATSSLDTAVAFTFRANSIFDPYQGALGTTVVGHATMNTIYNQYIVTGVKIKCSFQAPQQDAARVGIKLRIASAGAINGLSLKKITEQPNVYISGLNSTGNQTKQMSLFVTPWTLMGLSKLEYMANTSKYSALLSASPATDNARFDIFMVDAKAAVQTVRVSLVLIYYVTLFDRKDLGSTGTPF